MRDVVIVGGGPAGLAAALVLGRSRRTVTVCDGGERRNSQSHAVHGFPTRDGIAPAELLALAREELGRYPSVEVRAAKVASIERLADHFLVHGEAGTLHARRVLICTGLVDEVPDIVRPLWGKTVVQCPYCHGWELRDRRFAYWPRDERDLDHALLLRGWSEDIIVFSNGAPVGDDMRRSYARAGIRLEVRPIVGVRAEGDQLRAIRVAGGEVEREVLFVNPLQRHVPLVYALGLALYDPNSVYIDDHAETSVPGIHAAGDLVIPVQSALFAAANGAAAAYKVNALLAR